jgi:hypothetical protein
VTRKITENGWEADDSELEKPVTDNPNYPFPRQPKPVTVTIEGDDPRDVAYWVETLARHAEFKDDQTQRIHSSAFIIYPRAVND